ncbi:ribonuclease T2 [uncultured Brevundimonas sp.]|uniref:ribonuclease T2 n=1 Tax=uncultured Brevundimonas sp. TaxID=213418 RepID=UPI0030ED64ED|tara:strand:- start:2556 stop:3308 length:753 start_codon:yes stop_codon:yes gene_type:complete
MIRLLSRAAALALLLGLAACGSANPPAPAAVAGTAVCDIPDSLTPARPYAPPADEVVRDVDTAYHLLAISWSPQACRSGKDYPDPALQCRDNRFGLTLHGLWPNGPASRHPRYCGPAPALQPETVRANFCMTPSPRLQQHEWAAHGTCGWSSPEAYFSQAAALWNDLNRPDLEAIPADRLTAGAVRDAFVAANPGLPRGAITVVTADDDWLREVRLCYSTAFEPTRCPRGTGVPDRHRIRLAPTGPATAR